MSRTKPKRGARPRESRASRPDDDEPSVEQVLLGKLPKRGHLTEAEIGAFAELVGLVDQDEWAELEHVSKILRRPSKRLRALELMRHWGLPLSHEQRLMLPWFAGLPWHRPLSDAPAEAVALARHLLCLTPVPTFLLAPFIDPERLSPFHQWDRCRIVGVVGSGGGLAELRALDSFWSEVPQPVFESFLETADDVPVSCGLIDAFAKSWSSPRWLVEQAFTWRNKTHLYLHVPVVLRVLHELSRNTPTTDQAEEVARQRLRQIRWSTEFGETQRSTIPGVMPPELSGWQATELRTPTDYENEKPPGYSDLSFYFKDAKRGRLSIWSLRHPERAWVTVHIEGSPPQASLLHGYTIPRDEEAERVMGLWASANGIRHSGCA